MKIYFASANTHKKQEMAELFRPHTILIPADEGILFDPDETGSSFIENSLIKAKALWEAVKQPVIADDSGICVDALDGMPGIYSARYAGQDNVTGKENGCEITQDEKNLLLLKHLNETLEKTGQHNRDCHFVCSMVLYLSPDRFYCIQETFHGCLVNSAEEALGSGGFGYDPIVFLPEFGKTVAQLSEHEKNTVSHRAKAAQKMFALLNAIEE
ncbi:MAG: RdgB/HAM1 family non-canonical purine NTP pyrophosphatase [Spirochaetales bacterium]